MAVAPAAGNVYSITCEVVEAAVDPGAADVAHVRIDPVSMGSTRWEGGYHVLWATWMCNADCLLTEPAAAGGGGGGTAERQG